MVQRKDDTKITLYRAVEDGELADIYTCNCFRLGPNAFPKQFFATPGQAKAFGSQFIISNYGEKHYHLVSGTISSTLFQAMDFSANEPGIGPIITVPSGLLHTFNYEVEKNGGIKYLGMYTN